MDLRIGRALCLVTLCVIYHVLFVSSRETRSQYKSGDVRLIGGRGRYMGTVLVNHNGYWGAVCDSMWGINDATVVCKQVGYYRALKATNRSAFGPGRKRMWMTKVRCSGTEDRLADCPFPGWDRYTRYRCPGRYRSAGVVCDTRAPTTVTTTTSTTTTPTTTTTTTTTPTTTTTTEPTTAEIALSELELEIAEWAAKRVHTFGIWLNDTEANSTDVTHNNVTLSVRDRKTNHTAIEESNDDIISHVNIDIRKNDSPMKEVELEAKDGKKTLFADAPLEQGYDIRIDGGRYEWEGHLQIRENNGEWGTVCSDNWSIREAMVVCTQMKVLGKAKQALKYSYFGGEDLPRLFYSFKCIGHESSLSECKVTKISETDACPKKTSVAGVVCSLYLPDLVPSIQALQDSMRLQDQPLYYLRCSMEENCLSHSAYVIRNTSRIWRNQQRRLLRFSTVVYNHGLADFIPFLPRGKWEWHACHMHYHSMEVFSHYDIMDAAGNRLAEGSKASFCLQDSVCAQGVEPKYDCRGFGEQGLSVNCSDNYMHDIDCQWIDITDIKPGDYTFLMEVNPDLLVAESNYDNNVISCHLNYNGYFVLLRECQYQNLLDYRRPLKIADSG